jgi:MFS family permease
MAETVKKSTLQTNIAPLNLATLLLAAFASALLIFVSFGQEFVLTVFLQTPLAEQGRVGGSLQAGREFVVLFSIILGGILADKFSRRLVFCGGYTLAAIAFALFPLASTPAQLFVFYAISGVGAAFVTVMLTTVLADYITPEARGKFTGLQAVLNTLGAVGILLGIKRLPKVFTASGMELLAAGRLTYFIVAGLGLLVAVLLWFGLYRGKPSAQVEKKGFLEILKEGLAEGRKPGVALAYLAGFISRGDLVVVGVFLGLWINKVAIGRGMSPAEASAKVGVVLSIGAFGQLLLGFLIGYLVDLIGKKRSRVDSLIITALVGFVAYGAVALVTDPLGNAIMPVMVLLAIAQISGIIASQVFITQQARPEIRGSVIGLFGVSGAFSQICLSAAGGVMFDKIAPQAPFLLVALLNLVLFFVAIILRPYIADEPFAADNTFAAH